jgi:uncharacterized membrane protein YkvA (DUF1232 family)
MISPSLKLDKNLEKKVIHSLDMIMLEVDSEELNYVSSKFPKVYKMLGSNNDWTQDIVDTVDIMLDTCKWEGRFSEINKIVLSCAYYLCKPDDVIPDYTPGIGYLDDAFAVNESLKRLKKVKNGRIFCDKVKKKFEILKQS